MAIRPEIPERTPIENVEVEYDRASVSSKSRKPGFNRVRLLAIRQNEIELATRESFPLGEKITCTMHVKGVKNFMNADGEIKKEPTRITVLKQPAFSAVVQLGKLTADQTAKLTWAEGQLMPRQRPALRRREEEKPAAPAAAASGQPAPAAATAVAEKPAAAEAAAPAEAPQHGSGTPPLSVNRPVALLQLIEALDKFQVSDDLILAILEAAEAGLDVEALYPAERDEAAEIEQGAEPAAPDVSLPADGVARPMNVHRLGNNARLYFSEANVVVGPPSELIYLSRIKAPQTCFAVELGSDSMVTSAAPSFKPGSILVFSTAAKVENGDFAYIKTRSTDEFAQVFIEKNEDVRIRPLNPRYPEHVVRRTDVQTMCRLIGRYEDLSG